MQQQISYKKHHPKPFFIVYSLFTSIFIFIIYITNLLVISLDKIKQDTIIFCLYSYNIHNQNSLSINYARSSFYRIYLATTIIFLIIYLVFIYLSLLSPNLINRYDFPFSRHQRTDVTITFIRAIFKERFLYNYIML